MSNLNIGDRVFVQSYKHNGSLHRTWSKALVIDISEDMIVAVTDHTWVVEADNRRWLTKEPAICFFYTKKWYNIISMIRKNGIFYYCNVASPSLWDEEAIKNIDYDLDLKVFPDLSYSVLDKNEYEYHSNLMKYPENIKNRVENGMEELIEMVENKKEPFNFEYVDKYLLKYFTLIQKEEQESVQKASI